MRVWGIRAWVPARLPNLPQLILIQVLVGILDDLHRGLLVVAEALGQSFQDDPFHPLVDGDRERFGLSSFIPADNHE